MATARPIWVFFADKGPSERQDDLDAPVYEPYVQLVAELATVRHRFRWFNAVTVDATPDAADSIEAFEFVSRTSSVVGFKSSADDTSAPTAIEPMGGTKPAASMNYGASDAQNRTVGAVSLHDLGYNGQ
ncbi:MAG: hypothetical protein QGH20_10135, partial [Candidatus Latescibacteria bacterium]|nr:hypothetical protein [Candidatus Latescibacterota bacterium]